jgi:hypothetical protein
MNSQSLSSINCLTLLWAPRLSITTTRPEGGSQQVAA